MCAHFLGNIQEKIVVHDDTDANEKLHIEAIAFEKFVNTAALLVNRTGEPRNTTTLGFELPFDHVAEMNGWVVHFVSNFEYRHKNRIFFNNTRNFEKIILEKVFF